MNDLPTTPGTQVNLPSSGGGTSSYIYNPDDPNANPNGLVGNEMVAKPMEEVTVVGKRNKLAASSSTPAAAYHRPLYCDSWVGCCKRNDVLPAF